MAYRAQRGSPVIYVAASARELPSRLQDWLAEPTVRAVACPNVYDALATLARGAAPLALIISIDSIDWNELDFVSHALRVSPDTVVYVTEVSNQAGKVDAALALGARHLDLDALNELLELAPTSAPAPSPAGLLAGSLRTDVQAAEPAPRLVRDLPAESSSAEPDEAERPAVRLVSSTETVDAESAVPFPWSPAPDRPQRTPPKPAGAAKREAAKESSRRPPVKLTPEELSALLEPPAGGGKVQEGGS
jgi:hypothetical protein